jgi:hypothetical protein
MRHSFFQIEECIENEDLGLTKTKNTTVILSKGGDNFFTAHIENKKRYQKLVDIHTPFIHRTVTKVKQLGHPGVSSKLDENKALFKQYLVKNKWTLADMNDHQWFTDKYRFTCYGPQTGNYLGNTNGIKIYPEYGVVRIAHFDQDGRETRPYICCTAVKFAIRE